MSEVFNFDFDKLQKQGISKEATLNFLRTKTENNFNFDELENTFRANGFNDKEITNAMYYSLQEANKSGDLWLRPLPKDDLVSGNHSADSVDFERSQTQSLASRPKSTENHESNATILNHTQNPQETQTTQKPTQSGSIFEIESGLSNEQAQQEAEVSLRDFGSFASESKGVTLKGNDRSLNEAISQNEVSLENHQRDNANEKGYFEGILEGFGYETDNVKAINAKADKALKESVIEGRELKDLSELEKRRLFELYNDNKGFFELNSMEASLEKEYNRLKEKQNIAKIKDVKDLSQEQKEIIANDLGAFQNAWDYFFTDKQEVLKQWQDNYKAQTEILPQTQKAIAFLDNIHKHKSISNIIESAYKGEMNKEAFDDYLREVETIATTAGFDEIGYNKKGELYFYKGENAYKVNQGFFDNFTNILSANAGSISGGISGAIAGSKLAKTPQTAIAGAIAGGAVGAFVGGGADVLITNAYLNRENNFDEIVRHATEEGALSLVGDIALLGVAKYGGKALAKAQEMPLGKMIDYTPILGFAKRAIDGNASSAKKLIDKTYTQEQLQALKEMGESFGANLSFEAKLGTNPFKATFGDEHSFTKSYDILQNALTLPTQRARQQEFIQAIRADESGQLLAFLSEASAQSPKAYNNMRSILNATSFQVKKQLDNLNLNKGDIKAVFDELESGTKQSYDEAINKVIGGIYNDSYKVNLNELKREAGKPIQQEQKGIYNVAYNGKNATLIKQDLQSVDNAISFLQGTRYKGAKHERIKHLTDPSKKGYVTDLELVNLGKSIREYLAKHKEPFIDTNGARLYEWENKEGVRFRAVVNDVADMDSNPTTATQEIITFYSDRNLKDKMQFKREAKEIPTKSNLEKDLTHQEIKEAINKWDLTKPSANDKLIVSKVEQDELELLKKDFDFKGNYAVVREIDAQHLAHALNRHSDELVETSRNQIPITKDEILDYQSIIKTHDAREVSGNNITYKKQINGHYVAVEEVLTGKNKLRFVTMWKSKGNITTAPTPSSKGYDLDRTLSGSYDKIDSTTNKQTFESFKQSLESQGIPIESEVKSFINFVEKNIYNEKGVSFNQLNNALKTLNAYYKEAKDPNFKNHIKNAMDSFLREDIKAGIEAIFSQNKTAHKDISSLYASALSDYADMKEVLKIADKLKIRNATTEQNKALDSLLKLAKGQGDKQDNISSLTKALDKDNRALIELNMLSGLFQKSLYDDNALQIIDSGKFFKELQALHKNTFQSKEAQDFINIMTDFDKLFKNDILIAKALKPTTTGHIGSSIATSIEGAVKFQVVKSAFSHLVRLMPHIPFMNGLNQKVQGTALRYHLQKALENSFSVSDLKHTLQKTIAKAPYTSQTKSQIDKILNRVDKAQDELIEVAERNALTTQRKNLLDKLQYLKGTQATNKTDGRIAYISKDGLEKMLSGKAIGKSLDNGFSLENHLQAVENVLDLFTNAIFMQSQKPNNNSADIIAFHKYLAPFENADVKLTIKEINQNGNKIYSLELLEMSPVFKRNLPNANTQETKDIIHTGGDRLSEASTPNNTLELEAIVNAPKMQVHSQAIGEQYSKSKKPEPMHPDTPLENPNTIIPQSKQETQEIPPSENIFAKAQQEREAQEVAKQKAEQEALKAQKTQAQEFNERALRIIAQKEANAGKNVLDQEITQGGAIPLKEVGNAGSVSINDDNIYKLQYVIVKGKDLKPNFESNSLTQTRTTHNQEVVENIAKNFNADKVIGRGGFDDVPIILRDGQIISGNHRTQGMLQFTPESREAYERAIKEAHNIDLAPDELLMRIPQKELTSNQLTSQEIRALAGVSNKARESNEGDKIINSLGEYAGNIKELSGKVLQAENADEMALFVARALDKQSKSPNIEATNKALLAYNAPSNEALSLSDVFNKMQKELDLQDFNIIKDMYIKTAGAWHNLSNDVKLGNALGLDSLNLKPYLLYAIESSARFLNRARSTNFSYFNTRLQELMQTTDEKGLNPLLAQSPTFYDNLIGDILGASLARYARLENPTDNLFKTLINTKKALQEQVAPTLMGEGKSLKEADIFNFIEYIIAQGESSEQSGRLIGLLPSLREKYNAFNKAMQEPSPMPQTNALKGEEIESTPQTSDIIFTDKKGKEHTLTQEVQERWLKTFNLKSLDEAYTPKHSDEILQALGGKEIKLQLGSLKKLVAQGREKYIPQIKEVLDSPEAILKDSDNAFLFAKHLKDDDYFVNVSVDKGEYLVSISNGIKETSNIKNKLDSGAEVVYQSPNANSNLQTLLQTSRYSANKIDSDIIPQQANTSDMLKADLKEVQDLKAQYTSLQEKYESMKKNKKSQEGKALKEQIEAIRRQWLNKKRETTDKQINLFAEFAKHIVKDDKVEQIIKKETNESIQGLEREIKEAINKGYDERYYKTELQDLEYYKKILTQPESYAESKEMRMQELGNNIRLLKTISYTQDTKYTEAQKNELRQELELYFDIHPIQEFGTNYAEFYRDGIGAIEKLLNEKQGQVSGAFYRKELGDIDVVWGDSHFGLKHILDKHGSEFSDLAKELDEIIQNGEVVKTHNGYNITLGDYKVGLNIGWNENGIKIGENKWVVTAFDNSKSQSEKQGSNSASLTKGETLPLNSRDIIP